jgi:hypothetical protein
MTDNDKPARTRIMLIRVEAYVAVTDAEFDTYEAKTFEEVIENQKKWIDDGESAVEELIGWAPRVISVKLMPEDFAIPKEAHE